MKLFFSTFNYESEIGIVTVQTSLIEYSITYTQHMMMNQFGTYVIDVVGIREGVPNY